MKNLIRFVVLCLLGWGCAYAQSKLPAYQGSDTSRRSIYFGNGTNPNGQKYVGAFKGGKENRQDTTNFHNCRISDGQNYPIDIGRFCHA